MDNFWLKEFPFLLSLWIFVSDWFWLKMTYNSFPLFQWPIRRIPFSHWAHLSFFNKCRWALIWECALLISFFISKPVSFLPPEGNIEGLSGISRPFRPVSKPNPGHASIFSRNHRAASFRNLAAIQDSKLERGLKYVVFSLTPEKWCTTNAIFRVCVRNGQLLVVN